MVAASGYSGTSLAKKLGIAAESTLVILGDPGYAEELLAPLPDGVLVQRRLQGPADVVVVFARERSSVTRRVAQLWRAVAPSGALWVCWPKKSSPLWTGIGEQDWRDDLLPTGLVDTKVCAVDADWSGLKFVIRKEFRDRTTPLP